MSGKDVVVLAEDVWAERFEALLRRRERCWDAWFSEVARDVRMPEDRICSIFRDRCLPRALELGTLRRLECRELSWPLRAFRDFLERFLGAPRCPLVRLEFGWKVEWPGIAPQSLDFRDELATALRVGGRFLQTLLFRVHVGPRPMEALEQLPRLKRLAFPWVGEPNQDARDRRVLAALSKCRSLETVTLSHRGSFVAWSEGRISKIKDFLPRLLAAPGLKELVLDWPFHSYEWLRLPAKSKGSASRPEVFLSRAGITHFSSDWRPDLPYVLSLSITSARSFEEFARDSNAPRLRAFCQRVKTLRLESQGLQNRDADLAIWRDYFCGLKEFRVEHPWWVLSKFATDPSAWPHRLRTISFCVRDSAFYSATMRGIQLATVGRTTPLRVLTNVEPIQPFSEFRVPKIVGGIVNWCLSITLTDETFDAITALLLDAEGLLPSSLTLTLFASVLDACSMERKSSAVNLGKAIGSSSTLAQLDVCFFRFDADELLADVFKFARVNVFVRRLSFYPPSLSLWSARNFFPGLRTLVFDLRDDVPIDDFPDHPSLVQVKNRYRVLWQRTRGTGRAKHIPENLFYRAAAVVPTLELTRSLDPATAERATSK